MSQRQNRTTRTALKRNGGKLKKLSIAVTLIVTILVVLAVLWIIYHSSPGINNPGTEPTITFSIVTKNGVDPNLAVTWVITDASTPAKEFGAYSVKIYRDGIELSGSASPLLQNQTYTFSGTVKLTVTDEDSDGMLGFADRFYVSKMSGTHDWELSLIWAGNHQEIQSASWTTP